MKKLNQNLVPMATLSALAALALTILVGCAAVKREFSTPEGTTEPPPISTQLNAATPVIRTVVPEPWGEVIATLLSAVSATAAAYAAKHAKKATTAATAAQESVNGMVTAQKTM